MSTTPQSLSARLAQQRLVRGQAALHAGLRDVAVAAFRQAVAADPCHVDALLWLAGMCDDPHESMRHLTRVLALDPRSEAAHDGIRWARKRLGDDPGDPRLTAVPAFVPDSDDDGPLARPGAGLAERELGAGVLTASLAVTAAPEELPPSSPLSKPGARTLPQQFMATRFATPLLAIGLGLWLVLIGVMSGTIVWLLLHPAAARPGVPVVAQAAAAEPQPAPAPSTAPAGANSEPATVSPDNPPADQASLDALRVDSTLRELDSAWAVSDWERAAPLAAQALALRPGDENLRRKLMTAYFNRAVALMDTGDLDNALHAYNQALDVIPGDPEAKLERDTLVNYLTGLNSFSQRGWPAAIQALTRVYNSDAGYLDARELLYRANYNRGIELKQAKDLAGALKAFQSAVNLDNAAVEARGQLAQVRAALAPPPVAPAPVPSATGAKWIDVNLTTQRFRALRGESVVYSFVTSTGEPQRPTTPGRYEVLDKIPNAYSVFWHLWMPYWLGIYWAGSSENGIHALPILKSGQTLWSGFLGRRVSFGCVILDTSAAKTLYDWADIGTPVIIHN